MTLVSIIMPYYKKEHYLKSTIESILNQSHQNFEIILVDDQVDDKSFFFLRDILNLDSRIKLIKNDKNEGAGESRNKAIKNAKGEYIAFCDCDDLWKKEKLETQLNFMKNSNLDFSHTSYDIIDENNKVISFREAKNIISFKKLLNSCDIGLSTVMIRRKIFENNKYQFPRLVTKEDYVLWMIMAKNDVVIKGINANLTSWRKIKNSLSSSTLQKLLDGYKVYRVFLRYGKLKSFYCLIRLSINFILKN